MITGFNTDVRHGDVVFHVQTEDKGTGNPCVESLVYVGGQILARKRAGYRSLLDGEGSGKAIAELMERQHRSMIQEIRTGKLDQKLAEIRGPAAAPAGPTVTEVAPPPALSRPAPPAAVSAPEPAVNAGTVSAVKMPPLPAAPKPAPTRAPERPVAAAAPPAPRPRIPPRPPSPPRPRVPAARPRAEPSTPPDDRSLDQVILDYLEMESDQERLVLSMDKQSGELGPGRNARLQFRTVSSVDADPIGEAKITVRLISTIDEPLLLGEGRTDDRGELELELSIPELQTGTGAVIVTAESSIGKAEMRHLI